MVRPVNFGYNQQTAANNSFQIEGDQSGVAAKGRQEFDAFVEILRANGVEVVVIEDTPEPHTPDSIFPNNWFSTHQGGSLVLYPMYAPNRRLERKSAVLEYLKEGGRYKRVVDLTQYEEKGLFLEGTGSIVPDRDSNLAYVCRSPRSDESLLELFCDEMDFDYFLFDAFDQEGNAIYHTNVMMSVCTNFVVACLDAITNIEQRENFIALVEESDKEIIEISLEQMNAFAGNMLEVRSTSGEPLLVMSERAYNSLSDSQIKNIERYCKIIYANLSTIEDNGGGSARCMMAEIFS